MFKRYFPILDWGARYDRATLSADLLAAVIVTIMLIPQSLAYAMLAGLPAQVGLYASILPLVAYAVFGRSRALAVGPVAVVSLLTASAIAQVAPANEAQAIAAGVTLAFFSGGMLLAAGLLRLGFLANFLSHPVISGFITASGVIIAASQLKHILGVPAHGHTLIEIVASLAEHLPEINWPTVVVGVAATAFLFWARKGLKPLLARLGLPPRAAEMAAKAGPVAAVAVTTIAASVFNLDAQGVAVVGDIDAGLPQLAAPWLDRDVVLALLGPAALMSIIGFVESVSVAQTLAAKRRERVDPDQELIALGAANLASGASGAYPVTGGFSRSVVNYDAGAETPAAGAFTAAGILLVALFLTPLIADLPRATLAATIIVAVLSLVDLKALRTTWVYCKSDFAAMLATIIVTLAFGVELGVTAGVGVSIAMLLWRTSQPHYAIVGQVPGTEHFRNVKRHKVVTSDTVASLRVDESLYFANTRFLEDAVYKLVAEQPELRHVVLMCSAVNEIDASALESLEAVNARLKDAGVSLHLSEVKGPVQDRLERSHFLQDLTGGLYLTQHEAMRALDPSVAARAMNTGM